MIKVGILGASGYTGAELLRMLALHPGIKITAVSRQEGGQSVSDQFPSLAGFFDLELISHDPGKMGAACDVTFCCMPHKASMEMVPTLLDGGAKVIDLSADFRFNDAALYEQWYTKHTAPQLLKEAVFGLPELYRDRIKKARLVATPGCYPTGAILALAPLVKEKIIDLETIIVDSKSGVSGAGAKATETTHYIEANEGIRAYGVGSHRHTPEIEDHLSRLAGKPIRVSFTPHLTPMDRGMLTTAYAKLLVEKKTSELIELYRDFYKGEHFVRVMKEGMLPRTKWVRGSNFTDIGIVADSRTGRVVSISAIDNLVKGASGGAIQSMNIMMGIDEKAGLSQAPLFP